MLFDAFCTKSNFEENNENMVCAKRSEELAIGVVPPPPRPPGAREPRFRRVWPPAAARPARRGPAVRVGSVCGVRTLAGLCDGRNPSAQRLARRRAPGRARLADESQA